MSIFPDFSKCAVLVMGDVMLDRYWWGEVSRISPEAPVPVVKIKQKTTFPGGAANVALNLVGLHCRCFLLGICGRDAAGDTLNSLLKKTDIEGHLVESAARPTTAKTRVIARGQQIVRLDEEKSTRIGNATVGKLVRKFDKILPEADVVILSDYGKGVLVERMALEVIQRCRCHNLPVLVDPKGIDWQRYKGASCITPNAAELNQVAPFKLNDLSSLSSQAKKVIETFELKHLLVTRGPQGLSLFNRTGPDLHVSALAKEVFDISGAGDTVIATLAAARGAGLKMTDAAKMANLAAGIVVGKVGTRPIEAAELQRAFYGGASSGTRKIFTVRQAKETIAKWRRQGESIVFTNGCFDILHAGHIKLLHAAAGEGDKLVVGLNSDASIRRIKGPNRPVVQGEDRGAILASIRSVDMIVMFEEDTPLNLIAALQPDVIVKGGDYTPKTVVGHEIVEQKGGKVVIIPLTEGISTTGILEKARNENRGRAQG